MKTLKLNQQTSRCLVAIAAALAFASLEAATVTVKWTGGGDGSKWSDTSNWEDGASVDFTARNVYDLSAATANATLVNDTATQIGGFVLGESQGTVTLSSSVTATQMSGKWTIPASTTFVIQQAYSGKWVDYNKTTVTGGGTVRLESSTFAPQYPWTVTNKTTVVLAKGFSGMNFIQMAFADGSALKVEANGTTLGELDVDETSRVELGTNTLTLCGGLVSSYAKRGTIRGAVSGTGSIVLSGSKTVPVAASFPDFTGSLSLKNASLAFGSGCLFGAGVGLEETSSGILTLGGSQSFRAFSGTGTSGGLRVPAGAVATVTGADVAAGGTMSFAEAIRGDGGLTLDASGKTLVLNGVNSYKGPTQVSAGTLTMRNAGTATYSDSLLDGLLFRYSFDESVSYDSSANANDLTAGSTPGPVQAAGGIAGSSCAKFSRTSSTKMRLQSADNIPLSGIVPFTLSLWIRPSLETVTNGYVVVGGKNGDNETMNYSMSFVARATATAANPNLKDTLNVTGMGWVNLNIDSVEKWTHLVLTQDGTGYRKFYVNGALRKSGDDKGGIRTNDATLVEAPLRLGDHYNSWGACFDGEMDEVLMFNRELSADEIKSLYERPLKNAAAASVPEPVAHWAFDDASQPGKDAKGILNLAAQGDVAVASTDYTWGTAYSGKSHTAGYLAYSGAFPSGFPTGKHSFTVSIRMAVGDGQEGASPFAFGDLATNGSFFRIGATQRPSLVACNATANAGEKNKFEIYAAQGYFHSYALDEETALAHYVFSYDATRQTLTCYLDGVRTKTASNLAITLPTSGAVYVGYRSDALTDKRFIGLVDDVQIFDTALTGEEVRSLTRKLHFGDAATAGQASAPSSAVSVAEGATLRYEGPGHVVGTLSGSGRVELAPQATVALAGVQSFTGTIATEGTISLADGCTLAVDAQDPATPAVSLPGTVALPANVVVRVADDREGLSAAQARSRTFTVLTAAEGFANEANLATWTVSFAPQGSYKFQVKDGSVRLKFIQGLAIIIR